MSTNETSIVLKVVGSRVKQSTRRAVIEISPDDFTRLSLINNQMASIRNEAIPGLGSEYVTVCFNPGLQAGETRLAKGLYKQLEEPSEIVLAVAEIPLFTNVLLQGITHIEDGSVSVSPNRKEQLAKHALANEIDIRHPYTGATLAVDAESVIADDALEDHQIRLNYAQRRSLNIPHEHLSEAEQERLRAKYVRVNPHGDAASDQGEAQSPDLSEPGWKHLQLLPIEHKETDKCSLYERFCDAVIGASSLTLLACRPYRIDDSRDLVRLTADNMALLGLEDTDNVVLIYHGRSYRATVMSIDSKELMQQTNIFLDDGDLELVVGIPAPIRASLGIKDVETSVTVRRDCRYLFKKNANLQIVPLAALFISLLQIPAGDLWLKLLICIIASPFIVYATLSQERNKIDKRKKKRGRRSEKKA